MKRFFLVSQFLTIYLASAFCQSGNNAVSDTTTELKEVVVYGKSDKGKEVIKSKTLQGETLDNLNSHSVADALRYFSGVQLKDYGGVGGVKTLDVRSMGSNQMGVFYDGIQLGNAQNGQIDLGKYSLDNIESISLYNGQRSSIFQGAKDFGAAGTVYITTRRPKFLENKLWNANIQMRTGSFGLLNPSFRIERKLSEKIAASINAEYTYATGKYKFRYRRVLADGTPAWDTTATRRNGEVKALRLEGGVYGSAGDGRWYGKLYYYDSSRGIPGAIVNNVWKNHQHQWDRNFFAQGNIERRIGKKFQTCFSWKYAHDWMRYLNPDTTLMYLDNKFSQNEVYLSSANCYGILENLDINLAVDYQWNNLFASLENFSSPRRHTLMSALAASWRIHGLRMQGSLLYTWVHDIRELKSLGLPIGKNLMNTCKFTPAIFASYSVPGVKGLKAQGFYKRIFRMPTFNDLYYTDVGSSNLKPEWATQYDLGGEWEIYPSPIWIDALHFNLDLYHNRISDKIIAVPKGNGQYRWMMMNIGKVRIWGVDFAGEGNFSLARNLQLNLRATYTFQRALDYTDPSDDDAPAGTYRKQISYIPRHSGSVNGSLNWRGLSASYSFIYVGERWHNSSNIPINYEQPWYTSDASVGWKQRIGSVDMKFSVEINNIFNQQYEVIQNYPMPGRNYKFILQCNI